MIAQGVSYLGASIVCLLVAAPAWVAAADHAEEQQIYRYVNAEGRTVFVNGLSRVPESSRKKADPVDLSHISLNEELADDLQQAVDVQLSSLLKSDFCVGARRLASRGWLTTLWRDHGHLVVIGGALLLFLLASPYLIRTVGTPRWGKMLMVLLPALAVMGLLSTAAVKTSRSLRAVREAADPCQPQRYREQPQTPDSQARRLHSVYQLQERVKAAHRQYNAKLPR